MIKKTYNLAQVLDEARIRVDEPFYHFVPEEDHLVASSGYYVWIRDWADDLEDSTLHGPFEDEKECRSYLWNISASLRADPTRRKKRTAYED